MPIVRAQPRPCTSMEVLALRPSSLRFDKPLLQKAERQSRDQSHMRSKQPGNTKRTLQAYSMRQPGKRSRNRMTTRDEAAGTLQHDPRMRALRTETKANWRDAQTPPSCPDTPKGFAKMKDLQAREDRIVRSIARRGGMVRAASDLSSAGETRRLVDNWTLVEGELMQLERKIEKRRTALSRRHHKAVLRRVAAKEARRLGMLEDRLEHESLVTKQKAAQRAKQAARLQKAHEQRMAKPRKRIHPIFGECTGA